MDFRFNLLAVITVLHFTCTNSTCSSGSERTSQAIFLIDESRSVKAGGFIFERDFLYDLAYRMPTQAGFGVLRYAYNLHADEQFTRGEFTSEYMSETISRMEPRWNPSATEGGTWIYTAIDKALDWFANAGVSGDIYPKTIFMIGDGAASNDPLGNAGHVCSRMQGEEFQNLRLVILLIGEETLEQAKMETLRCLVTSIQGNMLLKTLHWDRSIIDMIFYDYVSSLPSGSCDYFFGTGILPTSNPTMDPTSRPTSDPTLDPTHRPTLEPTSGPTSNPTRPPTSNPTSRPIVTLDPTFQPTDEPTREPTSEPTLGPTSGPTNAPTRSPTTLAPTQSPTASPTKRCQRDDIPNNTIFLIPNCNGAYKHSSSRHLGSLADSDWNRMLEHVQNIANASRIQRGVGILRFCNGLIVDQPFIRKPHGENFSPAEVADIIGQVPRERTSAPNTHPLNVTFALDDEDKLAEVTWEDRSYCPFNFPDSASCDYWTSGVDNPIPDEWRGRRTIAVWRDEFQHQTRTSHVGSALRQALDMFDGENLLENHLERKTIFLITYKPPYGDYTSIQSQCDRMDNGNIKNLRIIILGLGTNLAWESLDCVKDEYLRRGFIESKPDIWDWQENFNDTYAKMLVDPCVSFGLATPEPTSEPTKEPTRHCERDDIPHNTIFVIPNCVIALSHDSTGIHGNPLQMVDDTSYNRMLNHIQDIASASHIQRGVGVFRFCNGLIIDQPFTRKPQGEHFSPTEVVDMIAQTPRARYHEAPNTPPLNVSFHADDENKSAEVTWEDRSYCPFNLPDPVSCNYWMSGIDNPIPDEWIGNRTIDVWYIDAFIHQMRTSHIGSALRQALDMFDQSNLLENEVERKTIFIVAYKEPYGDYVSITSQCERMDNSNIRNLRIVFVGLGTNVTWESVDCIKGANSTRGFIEQKPDIRDWEQNLDDDYAKILVDPCIFGNNLPTRGFGQGGPGGAVASDSSELDFENGDLASKWWLFLSGGVFVAILAVLAAVKYQRSRDYGIVAQEYDDFDTSDDFISS